MNAMTSDTLVNTLTARTGSAASTTAVRIASERMALALQTIGQIIAGVALPLMGYEAAFRTAAKDIWAFKAQEAAGLLFITAGVFCIADVVAKAFER